MISLTTLLIVVSALTLVVVVMQVMMRGSMSAARRRLFERVMMWGFYPVLTLFWGARGVFSAGEGDLLWAFASGLLALSMATQGVALFRKPPAADGTRT